MYHTLQLLKPFGIAGFTASPLSEEFPYSRLLWEFLFRGSAANPAIAQSRILKKSQTYAGLLVGGYQADPAKSKVRTG